ncbi:hypothetical protein MOUN0_J05204 [Monosporozyma unispora]
MGLSLTYNIKFFSQFLEDIPISNGVETQMSQLDMSKWKHFSENENFKFKLKYENEALTLTVWINNVQPLEHIIISKQDIELKRLNHVQFSIKSPRISCKYLKLSNNFNLVQRRFQMTLEKEDDFNKLIQLFKQINFVVKEAKVLKEAINTTPFLSQDSPNHFTSQALANQFPNGFNHTKEQTMKNITSLNTTVDEDTTLLETQREESVNFKLPVGSFIRTDPCYYSQPQQSKYFQFTNTSTLDDPNYNNKHFNNIGERINTENSTKITAVLPTTHNHFPIVPKPSVQPHTFEREKELAQTNFISVKVTEPLSKPFPLLPKEKPDKNNVGNVKTTQHALNFNPKPIATTSTNTTIPEKKTNHISAEFHQPVTSTNITVQNGPTNTLDHPLSHLQSSCIQPSKTKDDKVTIPILPKNNKNNCIHPKTSKILTTQENQPKQLMPAKRPKKKVHITRKLIKSKLKDKKFRKWVCIDVPSNFTLSY